MREWPTPRIDPQTVKAHRKDIDAARRRRVAKRKAQARARRAGR